MRSIRISTVLLVVLVACGPSVPDRNNEDCPEANLENDLYNCGECEHVCGTGELCIAGECQSDCDPGDTVQCYDGQPVTDGVGPCHGGMRTCLPSGQWSACQGQVLPSLEVCGNGLDENCSGEADENVDEDGDGFTTCDGDCCDSSECASPELVNPGSFDATGNQVDDDCDGMVDNTQAVCDLGLQSGSANATDYAKAMDICQTATETSRRWGVIDGRFTMANGAGAPAVESHSIRPQFGSGLIPQAGMAFTLLSSGNAAAPGQTNPSHVDFTASAMHGLSSPFPTDWFNANNMQLPNSPGCPELAAGTAAEDPVMLTLRIRVPSNAKSFSFSSNFFSAEFPEWVCSPYNDFFVVLLDSTWNSQPTNPADKNLAFYKNQAGTIYPVGVNLGYGNTGLFTQCVNGTTGCADIFSGQQGTISTCQSTAQLAGTGFDTSGSGSCDDNSLSGGGTGWLQTSGNVVGGEIITLRIAIWDTSDQRLDSLVVLDNFQWSVDVSDPGTVIGRNWGGAGASTPLGRAMFGR